MQIEIDSKYTKKNILNLDLFERFLRKYIEFDNKQTQNYIFLIAFL